MELRITNGSFAYRLWSDSSIPELLAGFQYLSDAETFVKAIMEQDAARQLSASSYLVISTNDGKAKILKHGEPVA